MRAAGTEISQTCPVSSANPGFRDFAVAAAIVKGRNAHDHVSFGINSLTRVVLEILIHAGARVHRAGGNGRIGMGQAPASGRNDHADLDTRRNAENSQDRERSAGRSPAIGRRA